MNNTRNSLEEPLKTESRIFRRYVRALKREKPARIGFVETAVQRRSGRTDSKNGSVRTSPDGSWSSAHIQKELDAYAECCERLWGKQQVDFEWAHVRCSVLMDEILRLSEEIEKNKTRCREEETASPSTRKRGEEELTDSQVAARRKRELNRKRAIYLQEISRQEAEQAKLYDELAVIYSFLEESDTALRLICERVACHVRQRIDVYWRAVVTHHPERESMPGTLSLPMISTAEETYLQRNRGSYQPVVIMLENYRNTLAGGDEPDTNWKESA